MGASGGGEEVERGVVFGIFFSAEGVDCVRQGD